MPCYTPAHLGRLGDVSEQMGIIETSTELAKLAQKIGNIEVYNQVIALQAQVMELMGENMKAKDDLRAAGEEIRKLRDDSELSRNLAYDGERYWLTKDSRKEGPFCGVCWDVDRKLVRMRTFEMQGGGRGYVCDHCRQRTRPSK